MPDPSFLDKIRNLSISLAEAAKDRARLVTKEQFWARVGVCDTCHYRDGSNCAVCGCVIAQKAQFRAFNCPKKLWSKIEDDKPQPEPETETECGEV